MKRRTGPTPGSRRGLLAAAGMLPLAALLQGCMSLGVGGNAPRFEFYALEDLNRSAAATSDLPRTERVLLVSTGQSQALYDSDRMVFSPDGVSRAFFQYSNWTERPARRLVALLERRLAGSGRFGAVALTTAGVRGDLMLSIRLDELFLDDASRPPIARLVVFAELVDWRSRSMLARRAFVQEVGAASADASGAAQASSVAVTRLLDELTAWVAGAAAAAPARDAG